MNNVKVGQLYRISSFSDLISDDFRARLMQFGFIEGEQIKVIRRAPIFKDPLLVEIKGSQIVISKDEASFINIEEL